MKRKEKTPAEPRSQRAEEPPEARQPDPCERERLEREMADSKPGAAGLALRSSRSKC
jgi:hypothetical protein